MRYWLMKSEPEVYSIDHLKRDKKTWWEGVRNYQARNFMMNDMKIGDQVLFYHSNAEPPGVAGMAQVTSPAQPDKTALQKNSPYFDPKATPQNPIWFCVEVGFVEKWEQPVSLDQLKQEKSLAEMLVLKRGQRLSIQPVEKPHFQKILKMAGH